MLIVFNSIIIFQQNLKMCFGKVHPNRFESNFFSAGFYGRHNFRRQEKVRKKKILMRGTALHRGSIFASHPAALGLILGVPKNFSLDAAEIY